MPAKTKLRNLEMLAAFEGGENKHGLAMQYHLTENRISTILIAEHHKVAVSQEPEYRRLRTQRWEQSRWN